MTTEQNQTKPDEFAGPFKYESNANPTIELFTNTALFLWKGREQTEEKTFIISYPSFLKRLRNMERAIAQDDPWADRTYYHVQLALDEADQALLAQHEQLNTMLDSGHRRLSFPETISTRPIVIEIENHSKLGWRACHLLLTADDCAKVINSAHHRGLIDKRENRLLVRSLERTVRSVLSVASRWKYMGVSRDDVAANSKPAQAAKAALGNIEKEFLHVELRSNFAPALPKRRQAVISTDEAMQALKKEAVS